jgi:signal transduction histidine kinase
MKKGKNEARYSILSVVGIDYFFLPPFHSFVIGSQPERNGKLCFFVFSAAIIALGESDRRAASLRRLEEARLRAANDQLERRVDERTTELREANEMLLKQTDMVRELSARLLQLRDEERRRIARELHDSVGQLLAAACMNTSKVESEKGKLGSEAARCLDELGLEAAIRWFVKGFTDRSHIDVNLTMALGVGRLPDDLELALFRILQEALTNTHRHSGSKTARIHLAQMDGYVRCEVSDDGKGIPPEKQTEVKSSGSVGVGLRGMRERVRQLGGVLQVNSNGKGTTVSAILPLRNAEQTPLEEKLHPVVV